MRRGMIWRETGRTESITEKGSYRKKEGSTVMAVNTKRALTESLLKLLHTKRFDKITISEITNGCGMNRMTFYYHFSDIYDLVVWLIENYLRGLSRERKDSKDWKNAFTTMLNKIEEYKVEVVNFYNGIPRDRAESFMNYIFYAVFNDIVTTMILDLGIEEKDYDFMLKFICYGFVGTILEWISNGLPEEEIDEIVRRTALIVEGTGWKRLKESV